MVQNVQRLRSVQPPHAAPFKCFERIERFEHLNGSEAISAMKVGGGERIRTAASRPKKQNQEVIPSEKEPGFPGFFILGFVTQCYSLSPLFGTKLEHFWNVFFSPETSFDGV
jgi:hypothetical protein